MLGLHCSIFTRFSRCPHGWGESIADPLPTALLWDKISDLRFQISKSYLETRFTHQSHLPASIYGVVCDDNAERIDVLRRGRIAEVEVRMRDG